MSTSKFTQKHYKVIAEVLNIHFVNNPDVCQEGMVMTPVEDIVKIFADVFHNDNPNFKPHLFYKASGVQL